MERHTAEELLTRAGIAPELVSKWNGKGDFAFPPSAHFTASGQPVPPDDGTRTFRLGNLDFAAPKAQVDLLRGLVERAAAQRG